jgi:hypothetical protein
MFTGAIVALICAIRLLLGDTSLLNNILLTNRLTLPRENALLLMAINIIKIHAISLMLILSIVLAF